MSTLSEQIASLEKQAGDTGQIHTALQLLAENQEAATALAAKMVEAVGNLIQGQASVNGRLDAMATNLMEPMRSPRRPFLVYNHMFYPGQPSAASLGMRDNLRAEDRGYWGGKVHGPWVHPDKWPVLNYAHFPELRAFWAERGIDSIAIDIEKIGDDDVDWTLKETIDNVWAIVRRCRAVGFKTYLYGGIPIHNWDVILTEARRGFHELSPKIFDAEQKAGAMVANLNGFCPSFYKSASWMQCDFEAAMGEMLTRARRMLPRGQTIPFVCPFLDGHAAHGVDPDFLDTLKFLYAQPDCDGVAVWTESNLAMPFPTDAPWAKFLADIAA